MSEIVCFVMDNAEEILQSLESFSKLKPKEIPKELDDYLGYVAKTGDPVYQWQYVRCLFHEKLLKVITEFYENSPSFDNPPCPNVDPFNYERMKTSLLERLDNFHNAPFTVQRICELLTSPRKHYGRVDKFMRAVEKNILVVSTREPGFAKRSETDETVLSVNGVPENKDNESDGSSRVNLPLDDIPTNNASCSPSVTVENAVNSCVIQEEIEINSASSTTAAEDKGWLETNESKMAVDPTSQSTTVTNKSEVSNNTSKADAVSTSSELDKASSSSTFLHSSEKLISKNNASTDQSKLINLPPSEDSPLSPEPNPDEVLCDASSDEESCSPQKNYPENFQPTEESHTSEVVDSEKSDESNQLDSAPDSEAVSVVIRNCENLEEIDSSVEQQVSSVSMAPDSSNECSSNDKSGNEEITVTEEEKDSEPSTITSSQHIQEETIESVADVSEGTSDSLKTEDLVQVELPESEEVTEGIVVNESVVSESECSVSIEEVTDSKEAEDEVEIDSKATDVVAEAPVEREVIVEEEEEEEEEEVKKKVEEVQESTEAVEEVCASSTFEVTEEETAEGEGEDEEPRESGSVIHTTQSVCPVEQEVEAESTQQEDVQEKFSVEENQVESICIDQSSCDATNEAEAMDVDDSASNQMAIGEVEMNEEEPMDQSDQAQP